MSSGPTEKAVETPNTGRGTRSLVMVLRPRVQDLGDLVLHGLRKYRWFLLAAVCYLIPVLVVSRLEVLAGPGQFPQGSNALNEFLFFNQWKLYPLQTWYSPWTDWGEPLPGYTGPTLLYAGTLTLNPATLVRIVELGSLWMSGLTAYVLLRKLGANVLGAGVAGFYYMLQEGTAQFFEGHVPFMISLAIAPIFLLAVYRFGAGLTLRWGLILAGSLYLLASIGDLGALYFLLFFSIPLLAYSIAKHRTFRGIKRSQVFAVCCSAVVFLAAMAPWWLPFLFGARPQYTTGITVGIAQFSGLRAEPIDLAYAGISFQNSFIRMLLGQPTYAVDFAALAPLYFVVPAAITLYVLLKRTVGRALLYGAGLLALLISTGPQYPGISSLNNFLYTFVPYFDYIPNISEWIVITAFVYTIFVGWLVTDLVTLATRTPRPETLAKTPRWNFKETTRVGPRGITYQWSSVRRTDRWRALRRHQRQVAWAALAVFATLIVVSVAMENGEIFSSPPQLFQFPSAYVDGYQFIDRQPVSGGVLTVPFSAIYERTPWGGVSVSTEVMAAYYTNSNAVVFEAGTPYSLAMDDFIHQALQTGTTDNLTKFLVGTNVQFVTATDYPNWTESSSALGSPKLQYQNLGHQVGLGTPVFSGGFQTVYELANPVGNLSFHQGYYVYFGSNSLVNEIMNQPFYNGTEPLLNGSELNPASVSVFLAHSSGVIVSPSTLSTLPPSVLSLANVSHVPIILIAGATDVVGNQGRRIADPWNASNALAIQPPSNQTPVDYAFNQGVLVGAGAISATGYIRTSCPSGALLTLVSGPTEYPLYYVNPSTSFAPLNLTNRSVVSAGINNGGKYPYNGSVHVSYADGQPYLSWNLAGENTTYQYLSFAIHNLTGDDGLTFTLANQSGLPTNFRMEVLFNHTLVSIPGYRSAGAPGSTGVSYSFQFSEASGPGIASFGRSLGQITRYVVGPLQTGSASHLNVTGLSYLRSVTGSPFENVPIPSVALVGSDSVGLSTTSECRIDTVTFTTGSLTPSVNTLVSYRGPQAEPLNLEATSMVSGWGLLLASQTFSPLWQLFRDGSPVGNHVVANLGLNAWLVNLTLGENLVVRYLGQEYQSVGIVIEVVGVPLVACAILVSRSQRARTGLRSWIRKVRRGPH